MNCIQTNQDSRKSCEQRSNQTKPELPSNRQTEIQTNVRKKQINRQTNKQTNKQITEDTQSCEQRSNQTKPELPSALTRGQYGHWPAVWAVGLAHFLGIWAAVWAVVQLKKSYGYYYITFKLI